MHRQARRHRSDDCKRSLKCLCPGNAPATCSSVSGAALLPASILTRFKSPAHLPFGGSGARKLLAGVFRETRASRAKIYDDERATRAPTCRTSSRRAGTANAQERKVCCEMPAGIAIFSANSKEGLIASMGPPLLYVPDVARRNDLTRGPEVQLGSATCRRPSPRSRANGTCSSATPEWRHRVLRRRGAHGGGRGRGAQDRPARPRAGGQRGPHPHRRRRTGLCPRPPPRCAPPRAPAGAAGPAAARPRPARRRADRHRLPHARRGPEDAAARTGDGKTASGTSRSLADTNLPANGNR